MFSIKELAVLFFTFLSFLVATSDTVLLRSRRQSNNGCELPPHPRHGMWMVYATNVPFQPSQVVPSGTILKIQCNNKYKLLGSKHIPCVDDSWDAPIGRCLRACPSRYNSTSMSVTCSYNEVPLQNCKNPVEGTAARFKCAPFYESASFSLNRLHICINGNWNYRLPECELICGRKVVKKPTLIINGFNTTVSEYPWQAAIYNVNNKELICGGSLINQRMVLTAAHCVTEDNGNLRSKELYNVAVGKTYRKINDSRDINAAQFSTAQHIFIPAIYRGETQNDQGDIAIIITKKTFIITSFVQPVCVDWEKNLQDSLSNPSGTVYDYVSGWGYTAENEQPSEVLKHLKVPLITKEECEQQMPEDYGRYLTSDKVCAGFLNTGRSVCKGDSGGGLVFKYASKYYVMGVVSSSPQVASADGGCDSQQYSLYTKVPDYINNFILGKDAQFRQVVSNATSCEDDPNSCTTITDTVTTSTTTQVPKNPTVVGQLCTLQPTRAKGECKYLNSCNVAMQNLKKKKSLQFCGFEAGEVIVCCPNKDKVLPQEPGDISRKKCEEFSEIRQAEVSKGRCTQSEAHIHRWAELGEFPHIVLIGFNIAGKGVFWGCEGAIISKNYVLTSIWCLSNDNYGSAKYVRAGVVNLNKPSHYDQIIKVDKLITPQIRKPFEDIGLIRLEKPIEMGPYVRPACLYLNDEILPKEAVATCFKRRHYTSDGLVPQMITKIPFNLLDISHCEDGVTKNNFDGGLCADTSYGEHMRNLRYGGSLQIYHNPSNASCMYRIVGLKSMETGNNKVVFTKFSNYVQWIEETVWPDN